MEKADQEMSISEVGQRPGKVSEETKNKHQELVHLTSIPKY